MEEKIYKLLLSMQEEIKSINTKLSIVEIDIKDIKTDLIGLKNITKEVNNSIINIEDNVGLLMTNNECNKN